MSKLSRFDVVDAQALASSQIVMSKSNVNQTTSNTTGVTLTGYTGAITTMPLTVATQGSISFTVTHTKVNADSVVLANIINYGGNGLPHVHVGSITSGNFQVSVSNAHATSPLNAAMKIAYQIL